MKPKYKYKYKGFTLFEILVAVFILAIIGAIMVRGLQIVIKSKEGIERNSAALSQLDLTLTLLQNDINNAINRPITIGGDLQPAFILNDDAAHTLAFTRGGVSNPLGELRSSLLRVEYHYQNSDLVRVLSSMLDQKTKTDPMGRVLLSQVKQLQWQFLSSDNRFYTRWPVPALQEPLPKAVQVTITFTNEGVVQLLFVLNNAGKPNNVRAPFFLPVY